MTRNDTLLKFLFAIEIALVPLAMAAHLLMPSWTVGLFIGGIVVAKIWMELFKNKSNRMHKIMLAIGNILAIASLVLFFAIYGYINLALGIVVAILAVLLNILKLAITDVMPEMIEAVDSCFLLFECLTLVALAVVIFYQLTTTIALIALLLTAAVSSLYRLYYAVRYKDVLRKFVALFKRK